MDRRAPLHVALIVRERGRFVLFLLRGGGKVELNRQIIVKLAVLEHGDRLQFGRVRWRFERCCREARAGPNGKAPPGPMNGPPAGERERIDRLRRRLGLTPRETEVLHWLAQGKTYPEIGMILGITRNTVHKHL